MNKKTARPCSVVKLALVLAALGNIWTSPAKKTQKGLCTLLICLRLHQTDKEEKNQTSSGLGASEFLFVARIE